MKVFLVLKERLVSYPPVLSLIDSLLLLGKEVVFVGDSRGFDQREKYESKGVVFEDTTEYKAKASVFEKFMRMRMFKRDVTRYLKGRIGEGDILWIMHAESVCLLHDLVPKYKTVLHFFEYVEPQISWKYRLLSPGFDMGKACRSAYKVVCCEYNRAHITKGLFQLEDLPVILPNKFFADDTVLENPPADVAEKVSAIAEKIEGKKVVLYQGIFLDKERRLEEFIRAINAMPDDYALIAMGAGSEMYEDLKKRYSSSKIIFVDFINPPYHLLVTKLASIGILSYFPRSQSVATVINPLYCAPNKTFEYSRYGIPMISNDVPALYYQFLEYHCGEIVTFPMTEEQIIAKIYKISKNRAYYEEGARKFYDSVDIVEIVKTIVG